MKVTVGVSGGIAAYKTAELVRALQRQALDVHVVMTEAAQRFITPLTFASLTGHKVITGLWPSSPGEGDLDSSIEHIGEVAQTDCGAGRGAGHCDVLAKVRPRLADDFLTTLFLATHAPVIVAPAMNVNMWEHTATRANMQILESRGVRVVPPDAGPLACGMIGSGRLAEPEAIVQAVLGQLHGRNDLVSGDGVGNCCGNSGSHRPGSFIGNRSSGKMGYAVAEEAHRRGARGGVGEWSLGAASAGEC